MAELPQRLFFNKKSHLDFPILKTFIFFSNQRKRNTIRGSKNTASANLWPTFKAAKPEEGVRSRDRDLVDHRRVRSTHRQNHLRGHISAAMKSLWAKKVHQGWNWSGNDPWLAKIVEKKSDLLFVRYFFWLLLFPICALISAYTSLASHYHRWRG